MKRAGSKRTQSLSSGRKTLGNGTPPTRKHERLLSDTPLRVRVAVQVEVLEVAVVPLVRVLVPGLLLDGPLLLVRLLVVAVVLVLGLLLRLASAPRLPISVRLT